MKYENRKEVSDILTQIEIAETQLKAYEDASDEINKNSMFLQIDCRCSSERKLSCEIKGELKKHIILAKAEEIKDEINRLKERLEKL